MAQITNIAPLFPSTLYTNSEIVSDGAIDLGFPELGTNSSVTFLVTIDNTTDPVDPADVDANDFSINAGAQAAGAAIDQVNQVTVFDIEVTVPANTGSSQLGLVLSGTAAFTTGGNAVASPTVLISPQLINVESDTNPQTFTFRVAIDGVIDSGSVSIANDFALTGTSPAGSSIDTLTPLDPTNTDYYRVRVSGLGNFDGSLALDLADNFDIPSLTGDPAPASIALETTQPGIASILRVSDLNGDGILESVTDPNVTSSPVLFQVKFTEAVRNVDISDFVPVGSAVISGVSVTDFDIVNPNPTVPISFTDPNAIRFTDINGVTYADTYVYTVSGLDGLSGDLGLALSQGVNGIRDVDGTSLITTDPPQGQNLDQTYTINNISTTIFVSVVASDADAREEATDVNVISDNFPDSQVPSPLPYSIATTANSDDGRTIQIQFTDSQGVPVNVTLPDPEDFQITAVLPRPVVSDGQVLGTGVIPNTVEALGESYLVTVTGLRNYTGTPTIRLSGTQDLQPASGDTFQASFGEATRNATTDSVNIEVTFNRDMLNVDSTDFDVVVSNLTPIDTGLTITGVTQVVSGLYNLVIAEANPAANTFDGTARIDLNPNTDLVPSGNPTSQDTGTFTLTRTGILSSSLTVRFRLDNVGNTQDSDYQVSGNNLGVVDAATNTYTVDIPALATETIVTITPTNDLALETTEIVRLVIEDTANYTPQSSAEQASVFITDNLSTQEEDLTIPRVTIEATDPIADEETGESARFVINIAGNDDAAANPDGLSIAIVAGGSAVIGEDYAIRDADGIIFGDLGTFIAANLTGLAVGVTQVEFFVIPNRDFVAGNRTVTFTIQSSNQNPAPDQADYTVGTPFVAGATILDVDAPIAIPDISIVASDPVGSEANKDTITFTLTRTTASTGPVTVFLQVGGDATAFEGELPPPDEQLLPEGVDYITDYQVTGGLIAVTFNEGETLKTITVTPIDDLDLDNGFTDEVISLTVLPSAFYTISDNATATGVIVNDEEPAIVIIEPASEVSEGGVRTFTVRIDGNAIGQDLKVTFNVGGSATNPNLLADANGSTDTGADAGDDYYIPDLLIETEENLLGDPVVTTTAPTIIIPAGSTSATFTVQTIDDGLGLDDDGETVIINLTAGEGYVVGTQNESTLTIRDINDRGVVSLNVTDATAQESDLSVASYVLERSGDNLQSVAVTFDVTGTSTFGTDYRIEAYDLDNPSVNLLAGVTNPVVNGVLTLTLPQGSPLNTTAGNPQQIRIDIVPIDDAVRDNTTNVPETVTLTLQQSSQDPTRGPSRLYSLRDGETTGTVNIVDDDPLISPEITLDSVVDNLAEGSPTTITVRLVGGNIFGSEIPISFVLGGSAVLGTDYTLTDASGVAVTNSIVFTSDDIRDTDGNGSIDAVFKNLTLTAISDGVGLNDDGETVIFSLTDGAGYTLTGTTSDTVILRDRSDRGTVTVAATDSVAAETDAATVDNLGTFTFTRTGDNLNTTLTVTFSLGGSATFTTDYTTAVTGAVSGGITTNSNGTFSFTFAALGTESGTQTATVTVTPVDDLLFETTTGFETIDLTLQDGGTSYSVVTGQTNATINLVDDEVALPPTITIVAVDAIAGETPVGTIANTGRFRIYRGVFLGDPNDAAQLADPANYANRGNTTDQDIVVTFTVGGTAGVNDYVTVGNTATIAAGEYFVDVVLSPIDDALANDNSETVTLTLVENAPTYLLGDTDAVPSTATVTILDNDGNAPTVSVAAVPGFADEQGTSSFFTISRTQDDNPNASINVSFTLSGIAAPSTDYEVYQNGVLVPLTNSSGTVTFGANVFATTLEVRPLSDATPESNETVTLTLNANPSYTLPTTGTSATTVIADSAVPPNDRVVPEVSVIALDPLASESPQATASFLVTFDGNNANTNPDGNLEIAIQLGGTATLGQDYFVTSPDLPQGNQPFVTDNILRIQNIPANFVGADGVNTVKLVITPFDDGVREIGETITLQVLPSTQAQSPANFADYTLAPPDPTNYALGATTAATVTILDQNDRGTIGVTATNANVTEAETSDLFTLTRTGDNLQAVTVNYTLSGTATAGNDYTVPAISGSITFAAGETTKTLGTLIDDLIFDAPGTGPETIILTLDGGTNYSLGTNTTATVRIADNETRQNPTISVTANNATVNEGQAGSFTITRSGGNTVEFPVTVNFTIGGTATPTNPENPEGAFDYNAITSLSVTFAPGETSKTVSLQTLSDTIGLNDDSETVTLSLSPDTENYNLGTATAQITILDQSDKGTIDVTATTATAEEGTNGVFTLTRTGDNLQQVTVNYTITGTANAGSDYTTLPGTITFNAGETSKTIDVSALDDNIFDAPGTAPETVILTLTDGGTNYSLGNNTEATVSITEGDTRTVPTINLALTSSSTVLNEGDIAEFTITRTGGNTDEFFPLTVNLAVGGTSTSGVDFTAIDPLSVTFEAGQTSKVVSLTTLRDGIGVDDDNETFTLSLTSDPNNYTSGTGTTATVTIRDLDVLPTVQDILRLTPNTEAADLNATNNTVTFQVVFSEAVANVTVDDFIVSGGVVDDAGAEGGAISISNVTPVSGNTYNVTVTGFTPHDGALTLAVKNQTDIASVRTGNNLPENPTPSGENQGYTIATDPTVSSVSFSGFTPDNNDLDGDDVARFRISFNEAVTGVDAADFNYSLNGVEFDPNISLDTLNLLATDLTPGSVRVGTFNGITLSVAPTDNTGRNYEITVTGLEQSGNVDLDISLATDYEIQDEAGNDLVSADLTNLGGTAFIDNVITFVRTGAAGSLLDPIFETDGASNGRFGEFILYRTSNAAGERTLVEFTLTGTATSNLDYAGFYADYQIIDPATGLPISPIATNVSGNDLIIDGRLEAGSGNVLGRRQADIINGVIVNGYIPDNENEAVAPPPYYSYLANFDGNTDQILLQIDPIDESDYTALLGANAGFFDDQFVEDLQSVILTIVDTGPVNDLRDTAGANESIVSGPYDVATDNIAALGSAELVIQDSDPDFFLDEGSLAVPRVTVETIDPTLISNLLDFPVDQLLDNQASEDSSITSTLQNLVRGGDTAAFFIRIEGNTTENNPFQDLLQVNYTLSGTAGIGTDYIVVAPQLQLSDRFITGNPSQNVFNIPAGFDTILLLVQPLDDSNTTESANESIVLTLQPSTPTDGVPYTLGDRIVAAANIIDDDRVGVLPTVSVQAFDPTATEGSETYNVISRVNDTTLILDRGTATSALPVGEILVIGNNRYRINNVTSLDAQNQDIYTVEGYPVEDNTLPATFTTVTRQQTGLFRFTRDFAQSGLPLTVNYTIGGTATPGEGQDYTALTGTVTFGPDDLFVNIEVFPTDDFFFDPNETVNVNITPAPNFLLGRSSSATVTIVDNEIKPVVSLAVSATELLENEVAVTYTITRTGPIGSELEVGFNILGNAQRTVDYNLGNVAGSTALEDPQGATSVRIAADEDKAQFTIFAPLDGEDLIDDGEQIILSLNTRTDYDLDPDQNSTTVTIRDRSDKGNINLSFSSSGNAQGTESSTNSDPVIFTLTRTGDNLQSVLVDFTFTGQADPGDYAIDVYRYDLNSSGGLSTTRTKLTDAQELEFFNNVSNFETLTSGFFKLPAFPSGTNIDPPLNSVTGVLIPQIIEIHLNPIVDSVIDRTGGAESVILTITESTNLGDNYTIGTSLEETQDTLTGTIFDATGDTLSNRPIVEIVATDASAFEGGDEPLGIFTLSVRNRQGDLLTLTENLTVNFTLGPATSADIGSQDGAPADYILRSTSPSLQANSIVIPAGQNSITLIVEPQDDGIPEEPEEFVEILLTTGFDYDQSTTLNSAIVSIVENEPAPFVPEVSITPISTIASERTGGVGKFRISRTIDGDEVNATSAKFLEGITLTLGGDASLNTDYNLFIVRPSGTRAAVTEALNEISILSGEEYVEVEVVPKQDQLPESSETVTLTVTGGSPTTYLINENQASSTVTITDGNIVSGVQVNVALASSFTDAQLTALGIDLANIAPRITGDTLEEDSNQPRTVFIVSRSGGDTIDNEVTQDFNGDGVLNENDTRRSQALIVNLDTTTGTATPNEDYASLAPTVTIPVGRDAVAIEVTPIGDTIADTGGDESVVVTIAPTATNSYTPVLDINNDPSSASVFIIDNENNAPTLDADLLDDFVLNEDAGAITLRNGNNRSFSQLVQDAFADEDTEDPANDNETLKAIRFVTLPANGELTLNGVLVTENQVLEFATNAEISEFLDSLRYEPDPDFFGQSSDDKSRPDRFKIVANDGAADSRETDIVINVRPVNDAPFYVLPGEDGFNGGSATEPTDFYRDSAVIDNRAFSGGDTRNFALLPGVRVTIRDFVQGGANEPNPVVGPQNEREGDENSTLGNGGNQTLTFSTDSIGDLDIFEVAPTISEDGTLSFTLKSSIPGGFGTSQVRLSVQDNGGTANNGIDTLTKGFFIVTADANALGNVITDFESTPGQTGGLIYNTTALPLGSAIRTTLTADVRQLGTSGSFDNIVGLYEIADPNGGIDLGRDLDGDGDIDTNEEQLAKDGIADITPNANMTAAERTTYARAALQSHVNDLSLFNLRAGSNGDAVRNTTSAQFNAQGQSTTGSQQGVVLEAGKLYAPFIIANGGTLISGNGGTIAGGVSSFITVVNRDNVDTNPNSVSDPVAYFSFSEVNPDRSEHLRSFGNNVYGFEDLPNGGDRDFNDAIFSFTFNTTVVA